MRTKHETRSARRHIARREDARGAREAAAGCRCDPKGPYLTVGLDHTAARRAMRSTPGMCWPLPS